MHEANHIRYPSINGLRALSIIMVLYHHLEIHQILVADFSKINWIIPVVHFFQDGQLGVNIFFCISGFLITSLLLQEEERTHTISLKNFFIRRTLRIFPAYFFLLGVYALLQIFGYIHIAPDSWLTSITYTKYFNWNADWLTAHAWSLSVEEHFYLLWPLIFISGDRPRKIIAILLFCLPALMRVSIGLDTFELFNDLTLFARIDAIAIGCIFALYKDQIYKICNPYWSVIFYISAGLLFMTSVLGHFLSNHQYNVFLVPINPTIGMFANFLIAIIMMYSIFYTEGIWFKILNLRVINYIGILSYSIYLWQQIFMNKSAYWYNQFPANIVCIMIAAMISYYMIEKPFLKLKSKFITQISL